MQTDRLTDRQRERYTEREKEKDRARWKESVGETARREKEKEWHFI